MDASEIIKALGGPTKIATQLGLPPNTVTYWRHRNSIPANRWMAIIRLDGAADAGVTIEALAAAFSTSEQSEAACAVHRDGGPGTPTASPAIAINSGTAR